jgi:hypothetical protein
MQESKRTLIYVGTAVVTVALAAGTHWAMQPVPLEQFSDVGEEFYPDFDDPNGATALRVAAYNEDAARVDVFNVEFKDGLWRIPSHHNYPADGEERLAKTATSVIGITRDAIVSTSADDFKRLGVLDPLDEEVTGTEGRGDRITLLDGEKVLADYIIGTKVEDQENVYHVRKPGEERTYRAALNLDISTKFADWIEPGLLDVRRGDLREIVIDRYSIDEARGVIVRGEVSELTRESSTASWELEDVKPEEEVDTSKVNSIINALEDLTIVGVRPKPPALIAALKGEGDGSIDVFTLQGIIDKGYFLQDGKFLSNEGEVHVGTSEGVAYVLQFGEIFTGSDVEIEIGGEAGGEAPVDNADTDDTAEETSDDAGDKSPDDAASSDVASDGADDAGNGSTRQSRYLFIRTMFDESLIESPGEKPVEPEPPADDAEANSEQPADDAEAKPGAETDAANEQPADNAQPEDEATGDSSAAEPAADDADAQDASTKQADYEQAMLDYEKALEEWERKQKAHEEKLEQGRKRVDELNARFANWYYVISADSFDDIRVPREALVKAKEKVEDEAAVDTPADVDSGAQATEEPGATTTDEAEAPTTEAVETSPAVDAETKPADDPEAEAQDAADAPAPSGSETPPAEGSEPPAETPSETPETPPSTGDAPSSADDEPPPTGDPDAAGDDSAE